MKIRAIYRHYWPDATPYAHLLKAILEAQVQQGHEVEVFTAQPSYNDVARGPQPGREVVQGVVVRRFSLLPEKKNWRLVRFANMALFLIKSVLHSLAAGKCDLVIANSHPPILIGLALRVIKWFQGSPYLLHCQDIHPEGAIVAGDLRSGWLSRWLTGLDRQTCRQAQRIVTLSADMKQTLLDRGEIEPNQIVVLNNFSLDVQPVPQADSTLEQPAEILRILFAGNMGRFQALERLLEALALVHNEFPLRCLFMGAGACTERLKHQAARLQLDCARFEPFQSLEIAVQAMRDADLGIISLAEGVYRIAYPSKTMTYLAAGCPVLSIVEPESQLAAEILRHEFGYVPEGTTVAEIADCLRKAWHDRKRWNVAARVNLAQRSERLFGRSQTLQQWNRLFAEIASETEQKSSLSFSREQTYRRAA